MHKSNKSAVQSADIFRITGEEGYSEYWRKNKSPIEARELGNVLLSLKKIASYIGRNVGEIVWSGMRAHDGAIVLDPRPYMGKYPVPAAKMDLATGLTILKAYKNCEWSEKTKAELEKQSVDPAKYIRKFHLFFDTAENIYVDNIANRSVFGFYTERYRDHEIITNRIEYVQFPTVKGLLYLWWKCASDRRGPRTSKDGILESTKRISDLTILHDFYMKPLLELCSASPEIISCYQPDVAISERCSRRAAIYAKLWRELSPHIKHWKYDMISLERNVLDLGNDSRLPECPDDSPDATRIIYLADKIQQSILSSSTDLTEKIKDNVINKDKVLTTLKGSINVPKKVCLDQVLLARCQRAITAVSMRRTVITNRGLTFGKIDKKRLYRAHLKGNAFLRKDKRFELKHDIILIVDASHSMAFKWDEIEKTVFTIFETIRNTKNNIRGFAYAGNGSACILSEIMATGNRLYSVIPQGKTASGEAIIATTMMVKERAVKKPLLIHITDGSSNWGCGINDAVRYCQKRKIGLIGLIYKCKAEEKEAIKQEYRGSVHFFESNQQLPLVLKNILS